LKESGEKAEAKRLKTQARQGLRGFFVLRKRGKDLTRKGERSDALRWSGPTQKVIRIFQKVARFDMGFSPG